MFELFLYNSLIDIIHIEYFATNEPGIVKIWIKVIHIEKLKKN